MASHGMDSKTKTHEVVTESRRVVGGLKKHCHKFAHILQDLQVIMKKERKKIAKIENSNYLSGGNGVNIEEIAAPVIRMENIEDKMKTELNAIRRFTTNITSNANEMEDLMWVDQAGEEGMRFDQEEQDRRDEEEDEEQRQAGQYDDDDSEAE
jgi:hypothetical protein